MKIVSYTALHYGLDYLYWAIRSVIDHVDEHWVFYSAVGSHGARTDVPCPESREQLLLEAQAAAGDKLRWVDGEWEHEGKQREMIFEAAPDADVILAVDADEVWGMGLAEAMVDYARAIHFDEVHRFVRLPIIHYWRSFHRAILHDPAFPVRVIYPHAQSGETTADVPFVINHLGYAQNPDIVEYKQLTHGHRAEWRHDIDWFRDRYLANAQADCHPVNVNYWTPEPVDPWEYMPDFMRTHPYADCEVIE